MYVAQDEEVVQEFAENNPLACDKLLRNGCYGTLSATCSGGRLFPEELTEETLVSRSFSDTWKADDAADSMHDFLWKTLWKPEPTLLETAATSSVSCLLVVLPASAFYYK